MEQSELEKRQALQKLFQDRMSDFSLQEPENYVSKLVKSEVPKAAPKKKKIKTDLQLEKALNKFKKVCFKPIVEINESNLDYSGSKYFGKTWLSNSESWPVDSYGNYLTFVMQLDIKTLPEKYRKLLGKTGLFQLFVNGQEGDDSLMRIVYPDSLGSYHEQPVNSDNFQNYTINGKQPQQKIITSWEMFDDYPHIEEIFEGSLQPLWEEIQDIWDDSQEDEIFKKLKTFEGDKLGGYAFWAQAGSTSEGLLLQLNAINEKEATQNAHAPCLFASDGTELVFYDKKNKSFYFDWACG